MFKLTVEGESLDELRTGLAAALGALDGGAPVKGKAKPPADEDEAPKPKPKAKPAAAAEEKEGPDYDEDIRPLILAMSKTNREDLLEIFNEFENAAEDDAPCVKGSQVAEGDYPALLSKLKKLKKKIDAE